MAQVINVIKANGEIEPFSPQKVKVSLMRSGASSEMADKIVQKILPSLYQNIPSFQIYTTVMKILKKEKNELAERYNLKRAIMELGPSGYPFEKFVAAILRESGYKTETNKIVIGKCISHEIDIIVEKNGERNMVECKFHNQNGGRCDVKEALYTYARFLDIQSKGFKKAWLVTNTKVTQDVKIYALCVGMEIISWDYPEGKSLRELIDKTGLYPITASVKLTPKQKQEMIDKGIVFCKDFPHLIK